ncbi:hypothetical protein Tco_1060498 [Tanacetum coccineum]
MMSFLTAVVTSRYPTTNNQLRNSSNPRQQATINNGRVTLQPIQGRQTSFAAGTSRTYTPGASGSANSWKTEDGFICYHGKGRSTCPEQCTKPKRKRYREIPDIPKGQSTQTMLLLRYTIIDNMNQNVVELKLARGDALKTQVANCTKTNLENKSVNETLTAKLERYKEQVKVLKEGQNVDLREKKRQVDTTPIDYAALNQLYKDFPTRFVPQTELSAEQAFWSQNSNSVNSSETTLSITPTNVEVPKELPKVSMVNTSLKKLKHHLANFDVAVKQYRIESKTFEVKMNPVLNENERLLEQVMSKDIVNLIANSSVDNDSVNVRECQKCLKLETELQTDFEIFQRENFVLNQSVPSFDQLFELNKLKAQSQEKDTVIKKLKERIKSLSGNMDKDKIKQDLEEIETINIELDHRVTKLIVENEHLKQTYKQLYDSIKPARIRSKEQCDDLINQVNIKSVEIFDLNASL